MFQCDCPPPDGANIELQIMWPFLVQGVCSVMLVIEGMVVRTDARGTAVRMRQWLFQTTESRAADCAIDSGAACNLIGRQTAGVRGRYESGAPVCRSIRQRSHPAQPSTDVVPWLLLTLKTTDAPNSAVRAASVQPVGSSRRMPPWRSIRIIMPGPMPARLAVSRISSACCNSAVT